MKGKENNTLDPRLERSSSRRQNVRQKLDVLLRSCVSYKNKCRIPESNARTKPSKILNVFGGSGGVVQGAVSQCQCLSHVWFYFYHIFCCCCSSSLLSSFYFFQVTRSDRPCFMVISDVELNHIKHSGGKEHITKGLKMPV